MVISAPEQAAVFSRGWEGGGSHLYKGQHDAILISEWLNRSWAGGTPTVDNGKKSTPWITQPRHNNMVGGKTNPIVFLKIMRIVNHIGKLFMLTHL